MRFGLMFFAASEEALAGNRYRLVIESARFADQHGFSSVWVPERHFTNFGSLYPNPAVLHAALARETSRIGLRAGSVVLPLHNPLRVAEEWAVVDNLSGGRVGISFASGWNPVDFAFFPERYQNRHSHLLEAIGLVRRLWRGEELEITSGTGAQATVRVYPTPVQPELPVWFTAAGNPQSFEAAGALGAHLLTHVLDQSIEALAEKIALYRKARAAHGHDPAAGVVSVMIHTFVGQDAGLVREQARGPYCQYLKSNIGLLKGLAQSRGQSFDITTMPAEDIDTFVNLLYDRFASTRGLIGTPESCLAVVRQLEEAGVDELACLLDFGPDAGLILQNLPYLHDLKERSAAPHARQMVVPAAVPQDVLAGLRARCTQELVPEQFYNELRHHDVQMDTAFRGIQRLWRGEREALGQVGLPDAVAPSPGDYTLHPALLDACLQVVVAALPPGALASGGLYLPSGLRSLRVLGRVGRQVWSHAELHLGEGGVATMFEGDLRIFNEEGRLLVAIDGLRLQRVEGLRPDIQQRLDAWLHDIHWERRPAVRTAPQPEPGPGLWLIMADGCGVAASLAARLRGRGQNCLALVLAGHAPLPDVDMLAVDPARPEELRRAVAQALAPGQPPLRGVLHLWSLDAHAPEATSVETLERDQMLGVVSLLHLLQALPASASPKLWLVTRAAQPVLPSDPAPALALAPLWGFGRTLPLELPHLSTTLVDLDPGASPEEASGLLLDAIWQPDREDQIAFRSGERLVARLVRDRVDLAGATGLELRAEATYLISGGLGSFGLRMARWLADRGARHLVLLGRSAPDAAARATLELLEQLGVRVLVARADVADRPVLAGVFEQLAGGWPPLRGIIHAAGVTGIQPISGMDAGTLLAMLRPKVAGTWLLHELSEGAELDFFVSISSLSPVWGTKGLAHYAAANHFLDMFGHYGRRHGLPVTTINVGPLADGGMAVADQTIQTALTQGGLRLLQTAHALDIINLLAGSGAAQKIIVDVDWAVFRPLHEIGGARPLLEQIEARGATERTTGSRPAFLVQLDQAPPGERRQRLVAHVQEQVARVLKLDPARRPDPQQGFFDMGMDSLMVLDLKSRLQASLAHSLPSTLPFDYPTIEALTAYLLDRLFEPNTPEPPPPASAVAPELPDDLAEIKGMSASELSALIDTELEALI